VREIEQKIDREGRKIWGKAKGYTEKKLNFCILYTENFHLKKYIFNNRSNYVKVVVQK